LMGGVIKSNLSWIPPNPLCYYSFIMIQKIVHTYHSNSQQNELFQTLTKEAVSTVSYHYLNELYKYITDLMTNGIVITVMDREFMKSM
jgi:hypothetical protein